MKPALHSSHRYKVTPDIYFAQIDLMIGKSVLHDGSTLNGVNFGFFTVTGNCLADQNYVVCVNQSLTQDIKRKMTLWVASVRALIRVLTCIPLDCKHPPCFQHPHSVILTNCIDR